VRLCAGYYRLDGWPERMHISPNSRLTVFAFVGMSVSRFSYNGCPFIVNRRTAKITKENIPNRAYRTYSRTSATSRHHWSSPQEWPCHHPYSTIAGSRVSLVRSRRRIRPSRLQSLGFDVFIGGDVLVSRSYGQFRSLRVALEPSVPRWAGQELYILRCSRRPWRTPQPEDTWRSCA